MSKKFDVKYHPHPEYRFWLFDPEGDGMTFYRTAAERDEAAELTIAAYLDDHWIIKFCVGFFGLHVAALALFALCRWIWRSL